MFAYSGLYSRRLSPDRGNDEVEPLVLGGCPPS
jgi:hypothetical protein